MKKFFKGIGALFLIAIVVQVMKDPHKNTSSSTTTTTSDAQTEATPTKPTTPLPDDEAKFIQSIQKGQEANKAAANDMQKGGARAAREKELCSLLTLLSISDWVGDVYSVSSNTDGKGVLAVTIAPDVYVKTWNNSLSDYTDGTLIDPSSALFGKASQLKEGQKIKFSGSLFRERGDAIGCLRESSLTLEGKLSEPEFVFRFSDVSPM